MSIDEALEVLGISDPSDAKAVRRAYLSRRKLHKPEIDPAGFQRIRQAFERLSPPKGRRFTSPAFIVLDDRPVRRVGSPASSDDASVPRRPNVLAPTVDEEEPELQPNVDETEPE